MGGSVRFDRAAEFYDESRAYPEDLARATTELLVAELRGRRSVLEVGVGTGLIALPLHEAGVPMRGLDISAPMVGKLIEKAGGRPFPLVIGDAAALPFSAGAVDAGLIRWVLHLIPDWRGVVAEVVRVVRPGGVLVVHLGAYGGRRWEAIRRRFEQIVGVPIEPVGIGWHQEEELDTEVARHGGRVRLLPPLAERGKEQLADLLDGIERNLYSWTWPVPDHARLAAAAELRLWAQERFGPLDRPLPYETTIVWRAYDLPG